jgi:hypothetical protein
LSPPVWAPSSEGLYTLATFTTSPLPLLMSPLGFYMDSLHHRPQVNTFVGDLNFSTVIHRRIGHISFGSRHIESTLKEVYGSKFDRKGTEFCTTCVQAKMTNLGPVSLVCARPHENVSILTFLQRSRPWV